MTDLFDAGKRALEDGDRTRALAHDARTILAPWDWHDWPREHVLDELLDRMSWPDACRALEFIDWEDNR